jgi:hemerythrin
MELFAFALAQEFRTGLEKFDEQHRDLIAKANQLHALLTHTSNPQLQTLFDELVTHLQAQFDQQTQWMRQYSHRVTHALSGLDKQFLKQRLDVEAGRAFRAEEPLSILLIELHFQADAHVSMVSLMQTVAAATKRPADFVAPHHDNRLMVVLPNTHCQGAATTAQRIAQDIDALGQGVTSRFGMAGWVPRTQHDGDVLLAEAEAALDMAPPHTGNGDKPIANKA